VKEFRRYAGPRYAATSLNQAPEGYSEARPIGAGG
jgi:hypothetical protein